MTASFFRPFISAAAASPSGVVAPPSTTAGGDTGSAREPVSSAKSMVAPGRSMFDHCPHCWATEAVPLSPGLYCTNDWHSRG